MLHVSTNLSQYMFDTKSFRCVYMGGHAESLLRVGDELCSSSRQCACCLGHAWPL